MRWLVVLTAAVVAYGVAGYMLFEGWSFTDAAYMTVIALTTVGFREARPLDTSGEWFTVTLLLAGVTLVIVVLSLTARAIGEGGLERSRRKRMQRRIDRMSDHFILCAYGRVGQTVAAEFRRENAPFVVIDKNEDREAEMIEHEVPYIIGDASDESVLAAAGLGRARGLISAVDDDAQNVFITVVARSLNPDVLIVARAAEEPSGDRMLRAGANRIFSPFVTAGREMANAALSPRVVDYMEVRREDAPPLRLEELHVDRGSALVGRTLSSVVGRTRPVLVRRTSGDLIAPPGLELELRAGDVLVLLGERDDLRGLEQG